MCRRDVVAVPSSSEADAFQPHLTSRDPDGRVMPRSQGLEGVPYPRSRLGPCAFASPSTDSVGDLSTR